MAEAGRLGRFGWKAGATSLTHQLASALNTDMGVMTTVLPEPDCGPEQAGCGNDGGAELSANKVAALEAQAMRVRLAVFEFLILAVLQTNTPATR